MAKHLKNLLFILPVLLLACMLLYGTTTYANTYLESTENITVREDNSYNLTEGVSEGDLTLMKTGGSAVKAHVVLIKAGAKAKIVPAVPDYYTEGSTKSTRAAKAASWGASDWSFRGVTNMVRDYESASDTSGSVVAAINGDFGSGSYPRGSCILEGNKEMVPPGVASDEFFFGYRDDGSLNIIQRTSGQKSTYTDAICGSAFILRNGNLFGVDNEIESRQRTGVALKPNGDALLIAVESGITVKQLAELMQASGCCDGINMDGGGSTTLVTKRSGDDSTVRRTPEIADTYSDKDENGERKVTSALMVVTDNGSANTASATGSGIATDKSTYKIGDEIKVTAYSDVVGAWVGLWKSGEAPNDNYYSWYYTYGTNGGVKGWANNQTVDLMSDGVVSKELEEPGEYSVAVVKGNSVLASTAITLEEAELDPTAEYTLALDKSAYNVGEEIKFKATAPVAKTWVGLYLESDTINQDISFFYYTLYPSDQGKWNLLNVNGGKVTEQARTFNGTTHQVGDTLPAGDYKAILFQSYDGAGTYVPKDEVHFRIKEPGEVDVTGLIELSGTSGKEKTYDGVGVSNQKGEKLYEYYYGDALAVRATTTAEGAKVGLYQDPRDDSASSFNGSTVSGTPLTEYALDSHKDQTVNLLTVGNAVPFGLNYWVVLTKGSKVLDAKPINYLAFNMDWQDAVDKNIKVELEWTSSIVNGQNQRPAVTVKQINNTFEGTFEDTLIENRDYFLSYPLESKEAGTYEVKITYPPRPNNDSSLHYLGNSEHSYSYVLKGNESEHIISYVLNGGDNNEENPGAYQNGEEIIFKSPARVGYIFCGWYESEVFSEGTQIEKITADETRDVTLYAKWLKEEEAPYKITYVLHGGTNDINNPTGYSGDVDISVLPIRKAGYAFDGWFFDAEFTKPADVIAKGTKEDLTLYAKFSRNSATDKFRISTDVTGGSISDSCSLKSGDSYTVEYSANSGYELRSVVVDGKDVDITKYANSYKFENVTETHSIIVTYARKASSSVTPETKPQPVVPVPAGVKDGAIVSIGGSNYKVISVSGKAVAFTGATNAKNVTVPDTVVIGGALYNVTTIEANAFTAPSIRTVVIGKNIKTIRSGAFIASKATKMIVKTKALTKTSVKGSLKGSKIKTVQVKVGKKKINKKYKKKYKKYFTKRNAGKKVKVK